MKKTITQEEIQTLADGLNLHGEDEIYSRMRAKAIFVMKEKDDIDEMFLDMSQDVLEKAREEEDEDKKSLYLTVSFLLRKLAHELYRRYTKEGKERTSERFLRVV